MVWGLNEKQKRILTYLYDLKDTLESLPPDPRLQIDSIAKYLGMKQRDVRKEIEVLSKKMFIKYLTFERHGYCKILPRGIREVEKHTEKTTEWEISTKRIGIKRSKREV